MTGPVAAALTLSVAVLVLPSSPRRRLTRGGQGPKQFPPWAAGWLAACALALSIVLLPLTTVFASVIFAGTMSLRYRRRRRSGRGIHESQELETAIDVLVGELRVGAHPASAFAVAAEETGGPVAGACRAVAARARLGADVTAGLRTVAETSALPAQWDRLAVCWQLAGEHGLAMSTLMRAAQRDIAERQRFSGHVRSAMAGASRTGPGDSKNQTYYVFTAAGTTHGGRLRQTGWRCSALQPKSARTLRREIRERRVKCTL